MLCNSEHVRIPSASGTEVSDGQILAGAFNQLEVSEGELENVSNCLSPELVQLGMDDTVSFINKRGTDCMTGGNIQEKRMGKVIESSSYPQGEPISLQHSQGYFLITRKLDKSS